MALMGQTAAPPAGEPREAEVCPSDSRPNALCGPWTQQLAHCGMCSHGLAGTEWKLWRERSFPDSQYWYRIGTDEPMSLNGPCYVSDMYTINSTMYILQ